MTYSHTFYLSRSGCSLDSLPLLGWTFLSGQTQGKQKYYIYLYAGYTIIQDTKSSMYLLDFESSPSLLVKLLWDGFEIARTTTKPGLLKNLNFSTNLTGKLKTPGGILVFQVVVQVCFPCNFNNRQFDLFNKIPTLLKQLCKFYILWNWNYINNNKSNDLQDLNNTIQMIQDCQFLCLRNIHVLSNNIKLVYFFLWQSLAFVWLCLAFMETGVQRVGCSGDRNVVWNTLPIVCFSLGGQNTTQPEHCKMNTTHWTLKPEHWILNNAHCTH